MAAASSSEDMRVQGGYERHRSDRWSDWCESYQESQLQHFDSVEQARPVCPGRDGVKMAGDGPDGCGETLTMPFDADPSDVSQRACIRCDLGPACRERGDCKGESQTDPAEVKALAEVNLVKVTSGDSNSSHSSIWSDAAKEIARIVNEKVGKCLGLRSGGDEAGRLCPSVGVPQRDGAKAAAPHHCGRIRNPYYANHGGMAWEERRPRASQPEREHGRRHTAAKRGETIVLLILLPTRTKPPTFLASSTHPPTTCPIL